MRPIVALLTDFGLQDHYVGALRGAVLAACPDATLCDVVHELPAHDVEPSLDAGLVLRSVAETSRDTLAWLESEPDAPVTGIGPEREAELLRLATT